MPSDLFSKIFTFFKGVWQSLKDGLIFLGGPVDMIVAVLDIAITSLVFYFILKLFRDSRAWQLLKGILWIIALALFASVLGLNTIGFMLNNTISILAIALLIIFQPELRKTLETVGRRRWAKLMPGTRRFDSGDPTMRRMIEAIVSACDFMSATRTGALIIIERTTSLGELQEQENAVALDAEVSTTLLKQIFYLGSPLHDGAVLIRDDRISAARIHVPLSDNYHLRHEFGTRHRAAVGASEIGDALAVVVSEERGTISLAVDGRLYVLGNADALRTQLYRFLAPDDDSERKSLFGWLRRKIQGWRGRNEESASDDEPDIVRTIDTRAQTKDGPESEADAETASARERVPGRPNDEARLEQVEKTRRGLFGKRSVVAESLKRRQRFGLAAFSVVLAVFFWLYVQVTVDPVTTRVFNVPLTYRGTEIARDRGYGIQQYPVTTVQVTLKGRSELLNGITANDLTAYVDVSKASEEGLVELPVEINTNTILYTKTEMLLPVSVRVNVYPVD